MLCVGVERKGEKRGGGKDIERKSRSEGKRRREKYTMARTMKGRVKVRESFVK